MPHSGIPPVAGVIFIVGSIVLLVFLLWRRSHLRDVEQSQYPDDFMTLFGASASPTEHGYTSLRMSSMFAPNSQADKSAKHEKAALAGRTKSLPRPIFASPENVSPRVEAHLILNSLNQMAARMAASMLQEDAQLFALSDYLRLTLASVQMREIRMEQEASMLAAYVELVARNDAAPMIVKTFIRDAAFEHAIRPHLTCNVARVILNSCVPNRGVKRDVSMWIDVEAGSLVLRLVVKAHGPKCTFNEDSARLGLGAMGDQMREFGEEWVVSVKRLDANGSSGASTAELETVVRISSEVYA